MDNKNTIINVATKLFSQRGYEGVGVQEIVDTSGITKPTLYHFFGNKRGLLDTILKTNYSTFFDKFETASNYKGDIVLTLTQIFWAYFLFFKKNPEFFRLSLALTYSTLQSEGYLAITDYEQRIIKSFEQLFIIASTNHGNLKGHHKLFAISLSGLLNYYTLEIINEKIVVNDDFITKAVKHYMHGIYAL